MKIDRLFDRKEVVRYLFWGVMTVLFNYFSYVILKRFMSYQIANLFCIFITKVFAYCTNRKYVFRTKTYGKKQMREVIRYIVGRGCTGVVDYIGLILLVSVLHIDDKIGKIVMIVIVTGLNYVLGKMFVFKCNGKDIDAV